MLALSLSEGVDESDGALVEGCGMVERFPPMLNNRDKVSAGCTTAASFVSLLIIPLETSADVLIRSAPLPVSECSDTAVVGRVDGRVTEVDRTMLIARTFVAGLMLDATSGVAGIAAGIVEEVAAKAEVPGLVAIDGSTDEEDIGMDVDIMMSAGIEGISVLLKNRATF